MPMQDNLIESLFENKKCNAPKLRLFGFSCKGGKYEYRTEILSGQFKLFIGIAKNGEISTEILEKSVNEKYTLHLLPQAKGAFVIKVRNEYKRILSEIAEKCFEKNIFKSACTQRVIEYIRKKYGDEPQYLWERFPTNAIFRRTDNQKWYAALLLIPKSKLNFASDDKVEIIDLRMSAELSPPIIDGEKYFGGYHMNKKHWFTMCLDGSVPIREIYRRIDASYAIASGKKLA